MNTLNTTPWVDKNVFDAIFRHGIGAFDQRFFERFADAKTPNYPPHNIQQLSDDKYRLTLAVAGFSEAELDITIHNDLLTVTGQKTQETQTETTTMLYNGIAFRDFTRQFKIGEHVYVDSADLKDGLLQIELTRRVPEAMKPKKIAIGDTMAQITEQSKEGFKQRLLHASADSDGWIDIYPTTANDARWMRELKAEGWFAKDGYKSLISPVHWLIRLSDKTPPHEAA